MVGLVWCDSAAYAALLTSINRIAFKAWADNPSFQPTVTMAANNRAGYRMATVLPPAAEFFVSYMGSKHNVIHSSILQQFTQRKEEISWIEKEKTIAAA